jgi:hypothetical protein
MTDSTQNQMKGGTLEWHYLHLRRRPDPPFRGCPLINGPCRKATAGAVSV